MARVAHLGRALALALSLGRTGGSGDDKRPVTVKDLIELSYIVDPARRTDISLRERDPVGVPIHSPDGKYFLLITKRGVLANNALEGTIWLFDRPAVRAYASGKSATKPVPRKLVTMSATSNTFVVYDVRWIDGSKTVAFLGKHGSPYQRLFFVDVATGATRAATPDSLYVTAYDVRGSTIVYTVLVQGQTVPGFDGDFISPGQRTATELLYHDEPTLDAIEEDFLQKYPSSLHLQQAGREVPIDATSGGQPIRLFMPFLALSPDAKTLITVAPVRDIPTDWEQYEVPFAYRRFKAGPVTRSDDYARPEQYVTVNLETGAVSPLLDAPAGRDVGYAVEPTEAFWLADGRHVVLTNTYLPLSSAPDAQSRAQRTKGAVITMMDLTTGATGASMDLNLKKSLPHDPGRHYYMPNGVLWDGTEQALTLQFEANPARPPETYVVRSGAWVQTHGRDTDRQAGVELLVRQDLNHAPALWASVPGKKAGRLIWDPNPRLDSLELGQASLYHWRDAKGNSWTGVLALPPHYDSTRRYPLVVQTHGYHADQFFADGWSTTGNGGRAFGGKDIVVLQMEDSYVHFAAPEEAPDNLAGLESAIDYLVADGMVDRSRVGAVGFSRTVSHVRYTLMHRPDLLRAASITDGFNPSYVSYVLNGPALSSLAIETERQMDGLNGGVAPFGDGLTQWTHTAVGFNLDKIHTPLLINVFERGELLHEWETYSGLKRLNRPVDLLWWWRQNTPHLLVEPAQRYASQQTAVDWFAFWLKGEEDPDPAKTEQYARWHMLRAMRDSSAARRTATPGP